MDANSVIEKIKALLFPTEQRKRDLNITGVFNSIESQLYDEGYEYPWILELMTGSDGQYAVFQAGGKLFRANYSVNGQDVAEVGEIYQVKVDYPKVEEEENRVKIFRNKETGVLNWIGIASSSVLNRVGEIDSTELFDDFERNFEDNEEPYLTLQHLSREFSFGTVKGVFRLGNLLFAYGEIDEKTFLGRFAADKFSTGDWGISIGFKPTSEPSLIRVGDVEIPTFNSGILIEVSALLEERAAAYFTSILDIESNKENRMGVNASKAKGLLVEFAGEENEDEIDALLEEAGKRERQIEEDNLVTRDTEETIEEVGETEEDDTEEVEDDVEIVLDDDLTDKLVENVSARVIELISPQLAKIDEFKDEISREISQLNTSIERVNEFIEEVRTRDTEVEERLVNVEKTEEKKIREVKDDLPSSSRRKIIVTHRPTQDNADEEKKDDRVNLREMSKKTLENIDTKNK